MRLRLIYLYIPILYLLNLMSCKNTTGFNFSEEKNKIITLHNLQRSYHLHKDSISFANQMSDHFISVNKGKISQPKKSETLTRYNRYFSAVEFLKWDDIADPIISFSEDGSLAYSIVDKEVIITYTDEDGNRVNEKTHFAWTTIYRKYDDEWKIDCVTSTNEPSVISPAFD